MIDPDHPRLSIVRQCELVSISRASFYRQPAGESEENLDADAAHRRGVPGDARSTAPARWRGTCGGSAGASAASACGV